MEHQTQYGNITFNQMPINQNQLNIKQIYYGMIFSGLEKANLSVLDIKNDIVPPNYSQLKKIFIKLDNENGHKNFSYLDFIPENIEEIWIEGHFDYINVHFLPDNIKTIKSRVQGLNIILPRNLKNFYFENNKNKMQIKTLSDIILDKMVVKGTFSNKLFPEPVKLKVKDLTLYTNLHDYQIELFKKLEIQSLNSGLDSFCNHQELNFSELEFLEKLKLHFMTDDKEKTLYNITLPLNLKLLAIANKSSIADLNAFNNLTELKFLKKIVFSSEQQFLNKIQDYDKWHLLTTVEEIVLKNDFTIKNLHLIPNLKKLTVVKYENLGTDDELYPNLEELIIKNPSTNIDKRRFPKLKAFSKIENL